MTETEILQRSMKSSSLEDLRSLLASLKSAELISDSVPGSWKLTKKGKEMVRKSLDSRLAPVVVQALGEQGLTES